MNPSDGALLSIRNLTVSYGHIKAVCDISFDVHEGEIVYPHRRQRCRQVVHAPRDFRHGPVRGQHRLQRENA